MTSAPQVAGHPAGDGWVVVGLGSGGSPHGADPYDEQAVWAEGLLPEVEVTVRFGYFSNDQGRFSRVNEGFARALYEDYAESSRVRRDLAPAGLTASKLAPIHWL